MSKKITSFDGESDGTGLSRSSQQPSRNDTDKSSNTSKAFEKLRQRRQSGLKSDLGFRQPHRLGTFHR